MATTKYTIVRIEAKVEWKVGQGKGGNWVAVCDHLKLTLQAETYANLMEDIALTLDAMLKDLLSTNELDRFLHEHGWTLVGQIPKRQENIKFDLPFLAKRGKIYGSEKHIH